MKRRQGKPIEWNGESLTATEWSKRLGIHTSTIESRARRGKPLDQERERKKRKNNLYPKAGEPRATKHPLYRLWCMMRSRCYDENWKDYPRYGGRGIKVCATWDNFWTFLSDMGERPTPQHTLDRIDNSKDYGPSNCRWATRYEQQQNTRVTRMLTWKEETHSHADWAQALGITLHCLRYRLAHWPLERVMAEHKKAG